MKQIVAKRGSSKALECIEAIFGISNLFFQIGCIALSIKKEERPGPEVASELSKGISDHVKSLKAKVEEATSAWRSFCTDVKSNTLH